VFWIRSTGCVSKREEKVFSLHTLFVLVPLHKPCEKSLLYPFAKKLLTGHLVLYAHAGSPGCTSFFCTGEVARERKKR
jgi:hypothetical protein